MCLLCQLARGIARFDHGRGGKRISEFSGQVTLTLKNRQFACKFVFHLMVMLHFLITGTCINNVGNVFGHYGNIGK